MSKAPKKQEQSTSELQRTLAGQISKSEKRERIARAIREAKAQTYQVLKSFRQRQILSK